MHGDGPPIRCLPLILVTMTVTTIVLVHMGSHQQAPEAVHVREERGELAPLRAGNQMLTSAALVNLSLTDLQEVIRLYLGKVQYECSAVVTLGNDYNGDALCDDPRAAIATPCLLYSFGYRGDYSFEVEVASRYGCEVFSFDPGNTQRTAPSPRVHLYDFKLGSADRAGPGDDVKTFSSAREATRRHVDELRDQAGRGGAQLSFEHPYIILKIEIDSADEWDVLDEITRPEVLNDVVYLFIELNTENTSESSCLSGIVSLNRLFNMGFRIYHTEIRNLVYYKVYLVK